MTVLAALKERYDRMAAQGQIPSAGFAPAKINYTMVLSETGRVVAVESEPTDARGRLLKEVLAPQAPASRRGDKIVPGSFWDPSEYALGLTKIDPAASAPGRVVGGDVVAQLRIASARAAKHPVERRESFQPAG